MVVGNYPIRAGEVGANTFVYKDNAGNNSVFWHGAFYDLFSSNEQAVFHAGQDVVAFLCAAGAGTYGFMPGQPAIANNGVNTAVTSGDVLITNASANFTLSIEYHKVQDAGGRGWTATG